jgi:hypothetical protein
MKDILNVEKFCGIGFYELQEVKFLHLASWARNRSAKVVHKQTYSTPINTIILASS